MNFRMKNLIGASIKVLSLFSFFGLTVSTAHGQILNVEYQTDPLELASEIAGNGVQIINPVLTCADSASGVYIISGIDGFPSTPGVILSTGDIGDIRGPNLTESKTTEWDTPGDPLLTTIAGQSSFDGCALEFDVVPVGDSIKFNFTFASEEYSEYVGTPFNDAFGFFIKGPGIPGDPALDDYENIAVIPGTSDFVEINSVNGGNPDIGFAPVNEAYFWDNPLGFTNIIQYDGWTQNLVAQREVTPCDTFHLKLVIADVGDREWDSAVMIEEIVSTNTSLSLVTVGGIDNLVEGCNDGTVTFTREPVTDEAVIVTYFLQGTAENGVDYPLIGGDPDPDAPKFITIPANQATATIDFAPFDDGIPEGDETVQIYVGNPNCEGTIQDSLSFLIMDELPLSIDPPLAYVCLGDSLTFSVEGEGSDFVWSPADFLNNPNIKEPTTTPTGDVTYTLTSTVASCEATAIAEIFVTDIALSGSITNIACGGADDGAIDLTVVDGQSPIEYAWVGPNGFTADTEDISGLEPGVYSVLVTDRDGCTATYNATISENPPLELTISSPTFNGGDNVSCFQAEDGQATVTPIGGTSPYSFLWDDPLAQTSQTAVMLAAGTYNVTVTDANLCTNTISITLTEPDVVVGSLVNRVDVLCFGDNTGSITVEGDGGHGPYTYAWNTVPPQFGPTASNLSAGFHTALITDVNGCQGSIIVEIQEPDAPLTGVVNTVDPGCNGDAAGIASAVIDGGTIPYTYIWSPNPGLDSPNITGLPAGSHSLTVIDGNGCELVIPFNISEPAQLQIATLVEQAPLCNGETGTITVAGIGGTLNYSFTWNDPNNTTGPTLVAPAGTYTVTLVDGNGCQQAQTYILEEPDALTLAFDNVTDPTCFDAADGSITAVASGGTEPYTYTWNTTPPSDGSLLENLESGAYSVTVVDDNGCEIMGSQTLTAPDPIQLSIESITHVLCNGDATGEVTLAAVGGTPTINITWDDPLSQTGLTATNLEAGTYTATAVDDNGCTEMITITINEPALPLAATITASQDVACFGDQTGSATVTATGGSGSYSYVWDDPDMQQTATATDLDPGIYNVTVSDNNGCATTVVVQVEIFGPTQALTGTLTPSTFGGGFNLACADDDNATIDLVIAGGTPPYDILWNLPGVGTSTDQNLADLEAGDYSVLITDDNGCTYEESITLTAPEPIDASFVTTPSLCFGIPTGTITTTLEGGVEPYTISWTGPNGFTSSDEDLDNLEGGVYTLNLTDANGCTFQTAATVAQPDDIIITVDSLSDYNGLNTTCWDSADGEIYITPSGGSTPYTYQWNTSGNPNFSNDEDVTGLEPGFYEAVVTDDNGCVQNEIIEVVGPDTIDVQFDLSLFPNGFNISCFGAADGSVEALPSGGTPDYTYTWVGPGGFGPTSSNPITNLGPGEYNVLVTDANGCFFAESVVLTSPEEFTINLEAGVIGSENISCNGGSDGTINLIINGNTGPYTAAWTGPNGFVSTDQDLFDLAAGQYCVVVTDANDCVQTECITLTEPNPILVDLTPLVYPNGFNVTCDDSFDGEITSNISGGTSGYTTFWVGPNNFTSSDPNITGLEAGTYCLLVTDNNGCEIETCIDLVAPLPILIEDDNVVSPGCSDTFDGSIEVSITNGTAPFGYSWTGPNGFISTDEDISGLESGTYCLAVTDSEGCTSEACFTIDAPSELDYALTTSDFNGFAIQCAGSATGSIDVQGLGGTSPYSYSWTGPNGFISDQSSIQNLVAGTYCVEIEDQNGCMANTCIDLLEPTPLETNPLVTLPTCGDGTPATIDLQVSGGVAPYSFNWSTFDDTEVVEVGNGSYSVIVTDANGCQINDDFNITLPDSIAVILISPTFDGGFNLSCFNDFSGSISMNVFGGVGNLTSAWTGPNGYSSTDGNIANLEAGEYCVTVTDDLGCTGTACITLTQPDTLTAALNANPVSCSMGVDGSISAAASGGVPTYTYEWTGPAGFTAMGSDISGLIAGNYCVTVTDQNGCQIVECIDVIEPSPISITLTSPEVDGVNILCFGDNSGSIDAAIAGGTSPYSFTWSGPNGYSSSSQNIFNLFAGEYCLTVTDENGCTETACITLTENPGIDIDIDIFEYPNGFNTSCGDACDGSLTTTLTGGEPPVTITWDGPNGFTSDQLDLTGLCAGAYTITTLDGDGCEQSATIIVSEPEPIQIDLDSPVFQGGLEVACFGENTGTILTTIEGGIGEFDIAWSGPNGFISDQEDLGNLFAGTYTITVEDESGCTATETIDLNEPAQPLTAIIQAFEYPSGDEISCLGADDGLIGTEVNGGTPPYSFNWNGPDGYTSDDQNISDLEPGEYTLVVEDANSCVYTQIITLTEPAEELTATSEITSDVSCNGGNDGEITVSPSGGSGSYEIEWDGPDGFSSSDFTISNLSSGIYTYIVTDVNGCEFIAQIDLSQPAPINLEAEITDAECETPTGAIDLSVTGGTSPYEFEWDNDEITEDLDGVAAGDYTVIVTDDLGCTATETYTVSTFNSLVVKADVQNLNCFDDSTGAIELSIEQGTEPVSYQWSGPDGYSSVENPIEDLVAGSFEVTATDLNGCTFTSTYSVGQPDQLIIQELDAFVYSNGFNLTGFQSGDGIINQPEVNGGTEEYSFLWTSDNGYTSTDGLNQLNLDAGTYSLIVTDANGCTDSTGVTLIEPIPFEIPNGISPNGDGFNDGLIVRGLEAYPVNKLLVFNRWGNMVYEESNYSNSVPWKGTNQDGEELAEGTYFVVVEVNGPDNLRGYLELRR